MAVVPSVLQYKLAPADDTASLIRVRGVYLTYVVHDRRVWLRIFVRSLKLPLCFAVLCSWGQNER